MLLEMLNQFQSKDVIIILFIGFMTGRGVCESSKEAPLPTNDVQTQLVRPVTRNDTRSAVPRIMSDKILMTLQRDKRRLSGVDKDRNQINLKNYPQSSRWSIQGKSFPILI